MDKNSKIAYLQKLPLFASLNESELEQLAERAQYLSAPRYDFVFVPDEKVEHLFFLVQGRIKTGTFSSDGRVIIKELVSPGSLFGDLILAGETVRSEFAQALHDGAGYLSVRYPDFLQIMHQNQPLMFACMQHLALRIRRVEERLANMVAKDARKRIIDFLQDTASREGRRVGFETLLKHHLTQQDIASLTGTSRQTVTSIFNELKRSNLIYFDRKSILIRDMDKLA